jgi:hypothetical protein
MKARIIAASLLCTAAYAAPFKDGTADETAMLCTP